VDRPFAAYKGDEPYIFVSYAHEDSDVVYPEIQWLKEQGFNIWYDEGISPGSRWSDELATSLKNSSLFLYFVTPDSVKSQPCQDESNLALDSGKPTIAVHLQDTELTPGLELRLSSHQAILKSELSDQEYRDKLLSGVGSHFGQEGLADSRSVESRVSSKRPLIALGLAALIVLAVGLLFYSQQYIGSAGEGGSTSRREGGVLDAEALAALQSIGVLPFTNMSSDAATGIFATGLAEEILDGLAQVEGLKVASRTASFQFSERGEELSTIAAELKVAYMLEGSVRKRGDILRITAQLIRVRDNFHVWSKTYERGVTEGFDMQAALALNIAYLATGELIGDVFRLHASGMPAYRNVDPVALGYYVRSSDEYRSIQSGEGGDWAVRTQLLKQAVETDPAFMQAHLALTNAYMQRLGGSLGHEEASVLGHAAIEQVMQLDPHHPGIPAQLGQIQLSLDLDYAAAKVSFGKGLANYPSWPWYHRHLATIALREGRTKDALRHMSTASTPLRDDPRYDEMIALMDSIEIRTDQARQ
jgi:TolB-like protein